MKNSFHIFCIATVFALLAASCKKEEAPEEPSADPVFSISDSTAAFKATDSDKAVISVKTNIGMEVTSAPDWITPIFEPVDIKPGAKLGTPVTIKLSLIASDNKLREIRSGEVVLSGVAREGFTQKIRASQDASPYTIKYTISGIYSCIPLFYGNDLSGSVAWGDGFSETYSSSATHKFSKDGKHTISISMDKGTPEKVRFEGIKEITGINLSSF